MPLRVLVEGVTLESKLSEAVRAYDSESEFKRAILGATFITGNHPTENYPLKYYGNNMVVSNGLLMTRSTGLWYTIRRWLYHNRRRIKEGDVEKLEGRGIYFKPTLIKGDNITWQRSDTDF